MRLLDALTKRKHEEEKFCLRCAKKTKLEFMDERPYSKTKVYYCPECKRKFEFGDITKQKEDLYAKPNGCALIFIDETTDSHNFFTYVRKQCRQWKYVLICINTSKTKKFEEDATDYLVKYLNLEIDEFKSRLEEFIQNYKIDILILPRLRSVRSEKSVYNKELIDQLYYSGTYNTMMVDIVY